MFIKVSVPGQFRLKMMPSFRSFLMHRDGEVHYIGGTDILPAPFDSVREAEVLRKFGTSEDKEARSALIEHNLRLVVYIARKFDNTSVGVEDLISIGTIGLIKAINTFDVDKNIKLATYASRCIENEILMHLRKTAPQKSEVSFDEPLNTDWDGNELLLSDVLGTEADVVMRPIEEDVERDLLAAASAAAGTLDGLMSQGRDAMGQAIDKLGSLLGGLEDSDSPDYLDTLLDILGGNPEDYGAFFAEPVQVTTQEIYAIANYGSAMTPFYSVLALWVGGTILVALIKVKPDTAGLSNPRSYQLFFGRYLLFFVCGQIQAAIIVLGDISIRAYSG